MTDNKMKISARETLTSYLKAKRLRKTPERYAILDRVFDMAEHFHIETLRKIMEADSFHVSRATLYNTMQLLVEAGLVRKHQFENQPAQYERVIGQQTGNHHHLICRRCGKVKEVKDPELAKTLESRRYRTFHTEFFALYVYGICSTCMRKMRKEKSKQ